MPPCVRWIRERFCFVFPLWAAQGRSKYRFCVTLVPVLSCAPGSLLSLLFIFVACFVFELHGAAVVYRPRLLMKHGVCFCDCPLLFFFFWLVGLFRTCLRDDCW